MRGIGWREYRERDAPDSERSCSGETEQIMVRESHTISCEQCTLHDPRDTRAEYEERGR